MTEPARDEDGFLVDWPLTPEAARSQFKQAQVELDRFRATLRLANQEIEKRNKIIRASTAFSYQAGRVSSVADLLQLSLTRALEVTESQVGAIVLIDSKSKTLRIGSHKNLSSALGRILAGRHFDASTTLLMPHLVAGHGVLLEYDDSSDDIELYFLQQVSLHSLVSLPMHVGEQLMGALVIGTQTEKRFSPAELHFLVAMAQDTAATLRALHVQDRLWHLAETLLNDENISNPIVNETVAFELKPPKPKRSPVAEKLAEILNGIGSTMGALYVIDSSETGMAVSLIADYGLSPAFTGTFGHFPLSDSLLPVSLLSKRRLIIGQLKDANNDQPSPLLLSLQQEGAASVLAGQINNPGQKLWFMVAASPEPNKLKVHHLKQMLLAAKSLPALAGKKRPKANQPTIKMPPPPSPLMAKEREDDLEKLLAAMMEAEEEVQRQNTDMAMLNAISETISRTLSLEKILSQVIKQIHSVLKADAVWVYLVEDPLGDVRTQGLKLKIQEGLSKRYIRGLRQISYGKPLEGLVAKENKARFVENVREYEIRCHLLVEQEGFHALAIIPLSSPEEHEGQERSRIMGVIGIGLYQSYIWQPREIRLLTAIANQVALGINNAQLYTKVKEDMTMLAASNEVLQTVNEQLLSEQATLEEQIAYMRRRRR